MVVTCPECGTRFTLQEDRMPGAVARVRCSRCRHVFRISREGQVADPNLKLPEAEPRGPTPGQKT